MSTKTLVLNFITSDGKKVSISVEDPRFDIIKSEVMEAMQKIIDNKVLMGTLGATLVEAHSAQIVKRTVSELKA